MSDPTTTTSNTTTTASTPQVDGVAVEPAAGDAAANVQPEKAAEKPVNIKVESESKPVEDQPKMDTTEIPAEKEPNSVEAQEKPAEVTEKSPEDQEKPSAAVTPVEAGDKPAEQQQPSAPAEVPVEQAKEPEVKVESKAIESDKIVEEQKKAEQEKNSSNEAMKVDEEPPAKALDTVAPEQPQPPKQSDLPTRQYLDATVVPILHSALSQLAKIRPVDPIDYLCKFLQEQKNNFDQK